MASAIEPLSTSILAIMYFGDVVFAISGALIAARYRMDVLGFVRIALSSKCIRHIVGNGSIVWQQCCYSD